MSFIFFTVILTACGNTSEDQYLGRLTDRLQDLIAAFSDTSADQYMTMGDYSSIPISSSDVEVSDDEVESYIESILEDEGYDADISELTDEFVREYSETYLTVTLSTTGEFEDYIFDYLYTYYLHAAMLEYLQDLQEVTGYDEEVEEMLMEYSAETLEYYASLYGYDADGFAALYGYDDAESYEQAEAHSYMDVGMLFDYIIDDLGLSYTDEDIDADLEAYMKINGYADSYTLDEFKETGGETWLWLYENIDFKYDLVMEALEDRVVFIDDEEESASTSGE